MRYGFQRRRRPINPDADYMVMWMHSIAPLFVRISGMDSENYSYVVTDSRGHRWGEIDRDLFHFVFRKRQSC